MVYIKWLNATLATMLGCAEKNPMKEVPMLETTGKLKN